MRKRLHIDIGFMLRNRFSCDTLLFIQIAVVTPRLLRVQRPNRMLVALFSCTYKCHKTMKKLISL